MTTPNPENDNGNNENQGNPHIAAALEGIPDEFVGILKPRLEEWDTNSQQKIQQVQQQYAPYKQFIDEGYDPEAVQNAVNLAAFLDQDPQGTIKRIADHFQIDPTEVWDNLSQGQKDALNDTDPDFSESLEGLDENHPIVKQLMESQQRLEAQLQDQQQGKINEEAEAALDDYLNELHDEHGKFDDVYVLALMGTGMDGDEAVQQFKNLQTEYFTENGEQQQGQQQPQQQAPVIQGANGNTGTGLPNPTNPPRNLDRQSTNNLVEQILRDADKS